MLLDRANITLTIRVFLRAVGKPLYHLLEITLLTLLSFILLARFIFIQFTKLARINLFHRLHTSFSKTSFSISLSQTTIPSPHTIFKNLLKLCFPIFYYFKFALRQLFQTTNTFIKKSTAHIFRIATSLRAKFFTAFSAIRHAFHQLNNLFKVTLSLPYRLHLPRLPFIKFTLRSSLFLTFITLLLSSGYAFYSLILKDLPHPKDLLFLHQPVTSVIRDRHGQILYKMFKDENRSLVSLNQIPDHVIHATLAIEDADFYQHAGFSLKGILRALQTNLTHETLQGGSTITQQLIKNTLLSSEKTYTRKAKELVLALLVESYFTKDEILTMYLNETPYGGTAYGIEAASQMYFNKSVSDLNLAEAALLAGLPAAPTTYSPYGSNPDAATHRQHEVLRRMVEEGYISSTLAQLAEEAPLSISPPVNDIDAPHFVMYVKDRLAQIYGDTTITQAGLNITTTLDYPLQQFVEATLQEEIKRLQPLHVNNAAAIITKPATGEVLAMAGSVDYFDLENDGQVNVALRARQPGSSIKPVNYALALENGYTAATRILDAPVVYKPENGPVYAPKNYDNRFHGQVTLRQALANSYNVPAVKTLNQFGVKNMVAIAQNLGITTWNNPERFGLALTLGGGEVTLADMAVVYGTFANYGFKVDLHPVQTVTDYTGTRQDNLGCEHSPSKLAFPQPAQAQADSHPCTAKPVLKDSTAFIISSILSDNNARTPTFGRHSVLNIDGHQVAVKTGTTNNLRDNWTLGYTKDYFVGVWVGNNDNTPMSQVASGITGASPIWQQLMLKVLEGEPPHRFDPPTSVVSVDICPLTSTLNCHTCPNPTKEYFAAGSEPQHACSPEAIQNLLTQTQPTTPNPTPESNSNPSSNSNPNPHPPRNPRSR